MECERQLPAVASTAVSKVLDDDNLLIEIIIRVGFPTSLVRAALVCRHWLQHISDPKFLRRFCKLHPPRLLGFYVDCLSPHNPLRFIPMLPQSTELTAVIRRANFSLDRGQKALTYIRDCRNGRVFTTCCEGGRFKHEIYNPLFPERGMSIIPPFPRYERQESYYCALSCLLSVQESDDLSYLYVFVDSNGEKSKSMVHVYMLRPGDGFWRRHLTLTTDKLWDHWDTKIVLLDNKIYMPSSFPSDIAVLDLTASSFSKLHLPQGVSYGYRNTVLSRADDASGIYLIQVKELQLCIWLHREDNWLMVDTICLVEMCANLRMSDCTGDDELWIKQVGDNVEFVFLQIGRYVLYLDIKCRTLRKVYEMPNKDEGFNFYIYPFKMIWPPNFPPLKDDPQEMPCEDQDNGIN